MKLKKFACCLILAALLLAGLPAQTAHAGTIRYVVPGGSTDNATCGSWEIGCELWYALATVAQPGDEIWVKTGTYKPSGTTTAATFSLRNGISIYGGFAGTESARDTRDWVNNVTTLTGSLGSATSYHVVFAGSLDTKVAPSTALLDGFTITGGNAAGTSSPTNWGGGGYIYSSSPTLRHLTFTGNQAAAGGGIYVYLSNSALTDITLTQNTATGSTNGTGQGGGMAIAYGSPALTNVNFDTNTATNNGYGGAGGGLYASYGNPTLSHVTFNENQSTGSNASYAWGGGGGGMYAYYANVSLTDCNFDGNVTTNYYGGGLFVIGSTASTLLRVSFNANQAQPGYGKSVGGGALYVNSSVLSVTDTIFTSNTAPVPGWSVLNDAVSSYGGAILLYNASPTFTRITVTGSSAVIGGGAYNSYGSSPTYTDAIFTQNTALDSGAGMLNYNQSSPTLRRVLFKDNTAGTNNVQGKPDCLANPGDPSKCGGDSGGGGMYNAYQSSPTLESVTFVGNSGGVGGAIYNDDHSNPVLRGVTITQNTALGTDVNVDKSTAERTPGKGAGIYNVMQSVPQITSSILWGNTNSGAASDDPVHTAPVDYLSASDASQSAIEYSDVEQASGFTGGNNIDADPLLGTLGAYSDDPAAYPALVFPLLPGSPAIDAGTDTNCPAKDARGVDRPAHGTCDMGAFESRGFTLAVSSGSGQSAQVSTAFGAPLIVEVGSADPARDPVDGGRVTFTVPDNGASAVLTTSPAAISSGAASVTAVANGEAGDYSVTASATGSSSSAAFSLHNLDSAVTSFPTYIPVVLH